MMPKRWSALACVFLAACHPYAVDDDDATETPDADTTVTPDASQPPGSSDDFPAMPALAQVAKADCSNGRPVRVRYAVDGDTLDLSHTDPDTGYDERVRLIGVDTPES